MEESDTLLSIDCALGKVVMVQGLSAFSAGTAIWTPIPSTTHNVQENLDYVQGFSGILQGL